MARVYLASVSAVLFLTAKKRLHKFANPSLSVPGSRCWIIAIQVCRTINKPETFCT